MALNCGIAGSVRATQVYELTTIHSYKLPHRVYSSTVYPRRSSNGSNIIIYAHEQGLRIIWYGGRKFKSPASNTDAVNGDHINLTDEDEDIHGQYEESENDLDIDGCSQDVLTYHDINFGIPCTLLAIPPLSRGQNAEESPPVGGSHIVVAAACTDLSLRLVSLPLEPTRGASVESQIVTITGLNTHQDLISGLAITFTAELGEGENAGTSARMQSRAAVPSDDNANTAPKKWSLLLVSASPTGNGLLLTHVVPIDSTGFISTSIEDHIPLQRQSARSSLVDCCLSFNTATYPDARHTHFIVSVNDGPAVKVYQALSQSSNKKKRRDSATTIDSATSTNKSVRPSSSTNGRPLLTLLPPFSQDEGSKHISRRKRILDAKWILQGQAILILLENGCWGIWDLESAGPSLPDSSSSHNNVNNPISGIQGGSLTRFAVRGNVSVTNEITKRSSKQSQPVSSKNLAPMTPHTRKVRSQGLFDEKESTEVLSFEAGLKPTGSISIIPQTQATSRQSKAQDESVLFTYNHSSAFIPSISKFWRSSLGGRGVIDGSSAGRPTILPMLYISGEARQSVDLLPPEESAKTEFSTTGRADIPSFIVTCASQILIFVPPKADKIASQQSVASLPIRFPYEKIGASEQSLLKSGELDIDGMDRILNDMANGGSLSQSFTTDESDKRAVGFLVDDDNDVDMNTPTQPRSNKSKLVVAKDSGNGRRLFT